MEKTPPHIYIAVQFPDAKDKRVSKQGKTDNLQSNENQTGQVSDFSLATWNARGLWRVNSKV